MIGTAETAKPFVTLVPFVVDSFSPRNTRSTRTEREVVDEYFWQKLNFTNKRFALVVR